MDAHTDWVLEDLCLDPQAREPLHAQLATALRDRIRDRRLQPGEDLPTEVQLQSQLGISRSVARQAMSTLVAEGLVSRSRGRGSVVSPRGQHHRLAHRAAGLSSQIAETGVEVGTQVLSLDRMRRPAHAEQLAEAETVYLERLRSIDGLPAAYIRTWLPASLGEGLTSKELTDSSLHRILETRHAITLTGGSRQVRAVAADAELARLLGTRQGAPLLLLEGVTTASDGTVVEVFSTWHRGDLIAFDLDVEDSAPGAASAPERLPALQEAQQTAQRLAEQLHRLTR
ncbi:GntR family transcriptional regulator [Nesterenkonia sp. MY13]|uniref:GntR family transcriptional regulator n=1 Tax=Nesterenkonia sedimenti TaxID=1463632 RepID=A0A7X8TJ84_9MICC|nr:GntR family transcriptional regulator [Nesterenkonia sedimenti]NLS09332.1 GntR family transcriptional regulator [Nesterenkonia sedimenti]